MLAGKAISDGEVVALAAKALATTVSGETRAAVLMMTDDPAGRSAADCSEAAGTAEDVVAMPGERSWAGGAELMASMVTVDGVTVMSR